MKYFTLTMCMIVFIPTHSTMFAQSSANSTQGNDLHIIFQNAHDNASIYTFAIDPNGNFIATGGDDYAVRVWHLKTGKLFRTLVGHTDGIVSLGFDPSGRYLISGGSTNDGRGRIWDLERGENIRVLERHDTEGRFIPMSTGSMQIDPTGHYVGFLDYNGAVYVFDFFSGDVVQAFYERKSYQRGGIGSFAFHPDGEMIAVGYSFGEVLVHEVSTGDTLQLIQKEFRSAEVFSFIDSGKQLLIGFGTNPFSDKTRSLEVWDWQSAQELRDYTYTETIRSKTLTPDDTRLLIGFYDNTGHIWNLRTGEITEFTQSSSNSDHSSPGGIILIASDGEKMVTVNRWEGAGSSSQKEVYVQDLEDESQRERIVPTDALDYKGILYSPDLHFFYYLTLHTIDAYRTTDYFRTHSFAIDRPYHPYGKHFIAVDQQLGKLASLEGQRTKIWDLHSGRLIIYSNSEIYSHKVPERSMPPVDLNNNIIYRWSSGYDNIDEMNIVTGERNKILRTGEPGKHVFYYDFYLDEVAGVFIINSSDVITLIDKTTGSLIKQTRQRLEDPSIFEVFLTPDRQSLCVVYFNYYVDFYSYPKLKRKKRLQYEKRDVKACALDFSGTRLATADFGNLQLWEIKDAKDTPRELAAAPFPNQSDAIISLAFHPQDTYLAAGHASGAVSLWSPADLTLIERIYAHSYEVMDLVWSEDGNFLFSASEDSKISIWNIDNNKFVTLLNRENEWLIYTDDGYFDASRNGGSLVAATVGLEAYNIDQFALRYNRPDIILERMGMGSDELIAHYNAQYQKRLRRFGITEAQLERGLEVPEVRIDHAHQDDKFLTIEFTLKDEDSPLKYYNIFINDVPLFSGYGKEATGNELVLSETVELTAGENKIEVTCFNRNGAEAYRAVTYAEYTGEVIPDLYYLGFGVSSYQNPELNLSYAHKDALDLGAALRGFSGQYGTLHVNTFTDAQVTVDTIKKAKDFVKDAGVDDVVVLFIAGHGVYSQGEDATYYYLTHDADIADLAGTAADFELIEDLLQGIKPRKKLFLMDTCESGEIDEEAQVSYYALADARGLKARASRAVTIKERSEQPKRDYLYQKDRFIYNDLLRRSGAIVFSSSRGGEFSYESDAVQNGLFTEEILRCLVEGTGDTDGDGVVSTDELRAYVAEKVAEATDNAQHPTVDRDNIYLKFGFPVLR